MLETIIEVENDREEKLRIVFAEGDYTAPHWIDMTFLGERFCLDLDDIMPALIAFDAKRNRGNEDE